MAQLPGSAGYRSTAIVSMLQNAVYDVTRIIRNSMDQERKNPTEALLVLLTPHGTSIGLLKKSIRLGLNPLRLTMYSVGSSTNSMPPTLVSLNSENKWSREE